jgi:predicted transcriptional regulator
MIKTIHLECSDLSLFLGSIEQQVMIILWSSDRPLLMNEILNRIGAQVSRSTYRTVIGRLVAKGLIIRQTRAEYVHFYEPTMSTEDDFINECILKTLITFFISYPQHVENIIAKVQTYANSKT